MAILSLECNQRMCVRFFFDCALTELGGLIKYIRPFLKTVSKAKAAKLVRNLVDVFLDMEASTGMEVCKHCNTISCCFLFSHCRHHHLHYDHGSFNHLQVELCNECIEWAMQEKRTFLRQALEVM